MRVLFGARDTFYLRNFESLLRELSARGHDVDVAFEISPRHSFRQGLTQSLFAEATSKLSGLITWVVRSTTRVLKVPRSKS